MSFEIAGIEGARRLAAVAAARQTASVQHTDKVHGAEGAVEIDTTSATVPVELYDAFSVASAAFDRLAEAGVHLHFSTGEGAGTTVEVQDANGTVRSTISATDTLRLAAGEPFNT